MASDISPCGPSTDGVRLLIHHHAVAYAEPGGIWVQSFIGAWVQALAKHFSAVGLLLASSEQRLVHHDAFIDAPNVILHSLGKKTEGNRWRRNARVRSVCCEVGAKYDVLLVRGVTPRQALVHDACRTAVKCYLLVGSPREGNPGWGLAPRHVMSKLLYEKRVRELRRIGAGSRMIANSPATVDELAEDFGLEASFAPTNTISEKDFEVPRRRPFDSDPALLFCGRVVEDKGIEELLRSIALMNARGLRCTLTVAGDSSPAYRLHLDRLMARLDIAGQVRFLGFVPFGSGLLELYRNADIYVLPSWHEGFPHSVWEAAAGGAPIVTTPVGGIPRLLSPRHAVFVPPRDAEHLAAAIERLLADPDRAWANAQAAHVLAADYTVERSAERLANLLKQPDAEGGVK